MRLPRILFVSGLALWPSLAQAEEPSTTAEPAPAPAGRASPLPRYYTIPAVTPPPGNSDAVYDQETAEPMTRSYGWQVLAIDAVAYGSGAVAFALGTRHRPTMSESAPIALAVGAGISCQNADPSFRGVTW